MRASSLVQTVTIQVLAVVAGLADRVAVLYRGRIVETLGPDAARADRARLGLLVGGGGTTRAG